MDVAIVTVGDELLLGATIDENAAWLADRVSDRGGRVREILTIGDDRERIASAVRERAAAFDRVIVTGGLGGTPDDVTMAGVADGLDRELETDTETREAARAASETFVESHPDLAETYDLGLDLDRVAEVVAGGRTIENPEGLVPGCAVENVCILPGVPSELRATFEQIADAFDGDLAVRTRFTDAPEGVLGTHLAELEATFDVEAGSYPGERADRNRVRIAGADDGELEGALEWLGERVTLTSDPGRPD
jgi:molybdenum cofactor synthesis domain-containing protein